MKTILHVMSHASGRSYKEAASTPPGFNIKCAWLNEYRPFDWSLFSDVIRIRDLGAEIVSLCDQYAVDILHVMSRPDQLTTTILGAKGWARPRPVVVHDAHEVINGSGHEERRANTESDFQVYVSEGIREVANRHYKNEKTSMVIPNLVPERYVPTRTLKKINRAVYEGSGWDPGYICGVLVPNLAMSGLEADVYSCQGKFLDLFVDELKWHKTLAFKGCLLYRPLLKVLTQYQWGLLPTAIPQSMQNKLSDYPVAGLPIASWPANRDMNRIIESEGIGIVRKHGQRALPDADEFKDDVERFAKTRMMDPFVKELYARF